MMQNTFKDYATSTVARIIESRPGDTVNDFTLEDVKEHSDRIVALLKELAQ